MSISSPGSEYLGHHDQMVLIVSRFIPLHAKTGPIPLIKSAFSWHNETGKQRDLSS